MFWSSRWFLEIQITRFDTDEATRSKSNPKNNLDYYLFHPSGYFTKTIWYNYEEQIIHFMNINIEADYFNQLDFNAFRPKVRFNKKLKRKSNWRLFDCDDCYDDLNIKNTQPSEVKFAFGLSSSESIYREDYYIKLNEGSLNDSNVIVNTRSDYKLFCLSFEPLEENDDFFVWHRGLNFNIFSAYRFWFEINRLSEEGQKSFKAFLNKSDKLSIVSDNDMQGRMLRY